MTLRLVALTTTSAVYDELAVRNVRLSGIVTPIILDYMKQDPWIAALEVLALYDAIARMRVHDHWQTDVIGGWLVGTGLGYWSSTLKVPLVVRILPRGLTIGISTHF
jgi:undecaprenyl-diphosphatase